MRTDSELHRAPRARPLPEIDVEDEVDLAPYRSALAARWWLPVLGLVLGVALGYFAGVGSEPVYEAEAVVSLGVPLSVGGSTPIPSLATNPTTVGKIIHSESALKEAAAASGIRLRRLRGSVATRPVTPPRGTARGAQSQLVEISVKGDGPRKVEVATNTLARRVVQRVSGYPRLKISQYNRRLASQSRALASVERQIDVVNGAIRRARTAGAEPLLLLSLVSELNNAEQRRAQLIDEQSATQQLLAIADEIESARVVERGAAAKTTARSVRNSVLVGGVLGLLLGLLAALLWEPVARRFDRREAM